MADLPDALVNAVARTIAEYPSEYKWAGTVTAEDVAQCRRLAELVILTVDANRAAAQGPSPLELLSPRERDVVGGLLAGQRLSDVARAQHVSVYTARGHLKSAFRKTGTHSQVELLALIAGTRAVG